MLGKAKGSAEGSRINQGFGIQHMKSCATRRYPERGLTCERCPDSFLLQRNAVLMSLVPFISTGGTHAFSLLQLEVEMKVLKSQECTAEQSTSITKEEINSLR